MIHMAYKVSVPFNQLQNFKMFCEILDLRSLFHAIDPNAIKVQWLIETPGFHRHDWAKLREYGIDVVALSREAFPEEVRRDESDSAWARGLHMPVR